MKARTSFLVGSLLLGCAAQLAAEPPAVSVTPPLDSAPASAPASDPPVGSVAPAAASLPPSDAERAQKGRAKADADHRVELSRWTPEFESDRLTLRFVKSDTATFASLPPKASTGTKP